MDNRAWCIYYEDGSTFDSNDGPFEKAPTSGVICIVRRVGDTGENIEFVSGGDYYVRFDEDGTVIATEDFRSLLARLGYVKFGSYTSNTNFARVMQRARDEWKGR